MDDMCHERAVRRNQGERATLVKCNSRQQERPRGPNIIQVSLLDANVHAARESRVGALYAEREPDRRPPAAVFRMGA